MFQFLQQEAPTNRAIFLPNSLNELHVEPTWNIRIMCGKSELKIAREFSRRTTCKKMAETAEENESRLEIEKKKQNKILFFR